MLQSCIESYFCHFFDRFDFDKQEYKSLLCPILGVYEIKVGNVNYFYMIMENLFYNQNSCLAYDLKGSQNNRLVKKEQDNQVLLDTNFILDFNGEPLCFNQEDKQVIEEQLKNDCNLLLQNNIVDYSLLLIINQDNKFGNLSIFLAYKSL